MYLNNANQHVYICTRVLKLHCPLSKQFLECTYITTQNAESLMDICRMRDRDKTRFTTYKNLNYCLNRIQHYKT